MKIFILMMGLMSIFLSFFISKNFLMNLKLFSFFSKNWVKLKLFIDFFSLVFFGVLLMIVFSVKIFSEFYLFKDYNYKRFYWVLMAFVLSMCFVIFFPNLIFILVGWDGLGLTSFILMIYYNTKKSWFSGFKTYLMNRLGDGLLVVWVLLLFKSGYWKILEMSNTMSGVFWIMILLGLLTKSAQFPFCSWLPAAMAAPTPVSSLVHSSTLVTAGIFILFRFSKIFSEGVFFFLGVIGSFTLILSSLSACVEWDFKKIIAFSTLSQLGLMCVALSLGLFELCFFHLISHASFKALLFICSGILLGQMYHTQDLRNLSKIKGINPIVDFVLLMSMISLCGFPFFSGFFSKDSMMEKKKNFMKIFFLFLLWVSLPLTVVYKCRMIYYLWLGKKSTIKITSSLSKTNLLSLFFLFFLSMFFGKIFFSFVKKKNFFFFFSKIFLLMILLFGVLFGIFMSQEKVLFFKKKFFFSKIFFCESKKTTKFSKNLSKFGAFFLSFDQKLKFYLKNYLYSFFLNFGSFKKIFLQSLKNFSSFSLFFGGLYFLLF